MTDDEIVEHLRKFEKSLKEVIKNSENNESEKIELSILQSYLPQLMDEDKIREIVSEFIDNGMDNFGAIMGTFNREYKGKADNKLVSKVVSEILPKK